MSVSGEVAAGVPVKYMSLTTDIIFDFLDDFELNCDIEEAWECREGAD